MVEITKEVKRGDEGEKEDNGGKKEKEEFCKALKERQLETNQETYKMWHKYNAN